MGFVNQTRNQQEEEKRGEIVYRSFESKFKNGTKVSNVDIPQDDTNFELCHGDKESIIIGDDSVVRFKETPLTSNKKMVKLSDLEDVAFKDGVSKVKDVDIRLWKDCITIYDCNGNPALYFHANNICAFGTFPLVDEVSTNDMNNDKQLVPVKTLKLVRSKIPDLVFFKDGKTNVGQLDFRTGPGYNDVEIYSKSGNKALEIGNDGRFWFTNNVPRVLGVNSIVNDMTEPKELVMIKTLKDEIGKNKATFKDGKTTTKMIDLRVTSGSFLTLYNNGQVFSVLPNNAVSFSEIPITLSGVNNDLNNNRELVIVKTLKSATKFKDGKTIVNQIDIKTNPVRLYSNNKKAFEVDSNGNVEFEKVLMTIPSVTNDLKEDNEYVLVKTLKEEIRNVNNKGTILSKNGFEATFNHIGLYSFGSMPKLNGKSIYHFTSLESYHDVCMEPLEVQLEGASLFVLNAKSKFVGKRASLTILNLKTSDGKAPLMAIYLIDDTYKHDETLMKIVNNNVNTKEFTFKNNTYRFPVTNNVNNVTILIEPIEPFLDENIGLTMDLKGNNKNIKNIGYIESSQIKPTNPKKTLSIDGKVTCESIPRYTSFNQKKLVTNIDFVYENTPKYDIAYFESTDAIQCDDNEFYFVLLNALRL